MVSIKGVKVGDRVVVKGPSGSEGIVTKESESRFKVRGGADVFFQSAWIPKEECEKVL